MQTVDVENDPMWQLLTDALRAGPGSPAWHEALKSLRATPGGDEHRLLLQARENLEQGKGYRAVRAGPGFTRKVLDRIGEADRAAPRWRSTSGIILTASIAAIVLIAATLVYRLAQSSGETSDEGAARLARLYLVQTQAEARFENGASLPSGFRTTGALALDTTSLLRPAGRSPGEYQGGAVIAPAMPATTPIAVEASVRVAKAGGDLVGQVFVAGDDDFSAQRATASRELVCHIQEAAVRLVTPDGRVVWGGQSLKPLPRVISVRLVLDQRWAMLDIDGQRVWTGEHGLPPGGQRYPGVRLLRKGGERDAVAVQSLRVLAPRATEERP